MTLPIDQRGCLVSIASAFYADRTPDVKVVDDLPEPTRKKIYERMWEVMGRPNTPNGGEDAFKHASTDREKKIEALEKVLREDVEKIAAAPPKKPTETAVELKSFTFDTGFDPRFSLDGNFLLTPTKWRTIGRVIYTGFDPRFFLDGNFLLTPTKWRTIGQVIYHFLFRLRVYYLGDGEEKEVRQLILRAEALETTWSSYYERLTKNVDDPCKHWVSLAEYEFLEVVTEMYKKIVAPSNLLRLFPQEVIEPIHRMNKPQDAKSLEAQNLPGGENADFAGMGVSCIRLNKSAYTFKDKHGYTIEADLLRFDYVPHYIFVHAIQKSSENLKIACRELRVEIARTTTSFWSILFFSSCTAKLKPALTKFNEAWTQYVKSHELLNEMQTVFSENDFRAGEYDALEDERNMLPAEFEKIKGFEGRLSRQEAIKVRPAMSAAYIERYKSTKTGRFVHARTTS